MQYTFHWQTDMQSLKLFLCVIRKLWSRQILQQTINCSHSISVNAKRTKILRTIIVCYNIFNAATMHPSPTLVGDPCCSTPFQYIMMPWLETHTTYVWVKFFVVNSIIQQSYFCLQLISCNFTNIQIISIGSWNGYSTVRCSRIPFLPWYPL